MSYEKQPDYACAECHRSFKNKRALKAHNKALHKPIRKTEDRLDINLDRVKPVRRRPTVCDGDAFDS